MRSRRAQRRAVRAAGYYVHVHARMHIFYSVHRIITCFIYALCTLEHWLTILTKESSTGRQRERERDRERLSIISAYRARCALSSIQKRANALPVRLLCVVTQISGECTLRRLLSRRLRDFGFVPSYIGAFLSTAVVVETASESPGWFYIGFQVARLVGYARLSRRLCD